LYEFTRALEYKPYIHMHAITLQC